MKIVCDSAKLAKLCMNVQRTVSSKSTIPAIEGILIDALGDSIRLTGYRSGGKRQHHPECKEFLRYSAYAPG